MEYIVADVENEDGDVMVMDMRSNKSFRRRIEEQERSNGCEANWRIPNWSIHGVFAKITAQQMCRAEFHHADNRVFFRLDCGNKLPVFFTFLCLSAIAQLYLVELLRYFFIGRDYAW